MIQVFCDYGDGRWQSRTHYTSPWSSAVEQFRAVLLEDYTHREDTPMVTRVLFVQGGTPTEPPRAREYAVRLRADVVLDEFPPPSREEPDLPEPHLPDRPQSM